MKYSEMLNLYIQESGLSLGEIANRMTEKGVKVDRSYLSKLRNGGTKNPASNEINKIFAEVTGGDPDKLIKAAKIERALKPLQDIVDYEDLVDSGLSEVLSDVIKEKPSSYATEKDFVKDIDLSDDEIISKYSISVDGKDLTQEEFYDLLVYIRFRRQHDRRS